MPTGFFTIEQWTRARAGSALEWIPVLHIDAKHSLTKAIAALEKRDEPGLYRVVQTQRCIWAEMEKGKVRWHRSRVSSLESLAKLTVLYEKEGGRRPLERARQERTAARRARAR
jgi:hypothetical protein